MLYDFIFVIYVGLFEYVIDFRKFIVLFKYLGVYFSDYYNLSVIDVCKLRVFYDCLLGKKIFFVNRMVIIVVIIFYCMVIFLY